MRRFEIGTIQVEAAIFQDSGGARYVVGRDDMDYIEFLHRYGAVPHKRATGVELDGCGKRFFLVYVEDCFDPPCAIVRADHEGDAEEAFVDALDWAHIKEPDLKDYDEDSLSYGPSGQPYDSQSVRIVEVRLVGVE